MKPKFTYNQFIVKKAREVIFYNWLGCTCSMGTDKVSYGVFKVTPYGDFDITYKVVLVPVGESADKFTIMDYYTSDLRDVPEEMIFDDEKLAEKFVKEFPIENVK